MKLFPNILLATANEAMREECRNAIVPMNWPLTEVSNAHDAICELENEESDIDVLLLDLILPDLDGIKLASEVTRKFSAVKRIMIAQAPSNDDLLRAINKGHVQNLFTLPLKRIQLHEAILHAYKTKQWDDERKAQETTLHTKYQDLQVRTKNLKSKAKEIQSRNRGLNQDLENRTEELHQTSLFIDAAQLDLTHAYTQSVEVLSGLLELHSRKQGRGKKIAELATVVAHELSLPPYDIQQISYAAQLVEASKVILKDSFSAKALDDMNGQELKIFHQYPIIAQSALMPLEHLNGAAKLLRNIEENMDGSGFPDRLKGIAIPLGSRILRIIRDYMALICGDRENVELDQAQAIATLRLSANHMYDLELLDLLESLLKMRSEKVIPIAIQTAGLQTGMIVAHDFFTKHHILLLAKGTVINEEMIEKIISYQQDSGEILILPIAEDSLQEKDT